MDFDCVISNIGNHCHIFGHQITVRRALFDTFFQPFTTMDVEDWELIAFAQGSTNHETPLPPASLQVPASTTSGSRSPMQTLPKSRPLQRPVFSTKPRIRAAHSISYPTSLNTRGTPGSGPTHRVSQLDHACPLQRPEWNCVHVASGPPKPHGEPLPAPPLRIGYIPSTGPSMRLSSTSENLVVSPGPGISTKLQPRPTRKTPDNLAKPKKPRTALASRGNTCSTCPAVQSIWPQFLAAFQQRSTLLHNLSSSAYFDDHCQRILDSFAASTIYRYLSTVMQFYATCISMRIPLEGLTEIQFADILVAGRSSDPKVSSSMCIKSIRWAYKQFNIQCFQIAFGPLISSFTKEHAVTDRREALPYSLLTLVQWERRVLQSSATQQEILGIGSFLLMMWSSMRFADLQRTRLSTLACDKTSLRGLSYRTKTCKSGGPFGLLCKGFLSTGSFTWVHRFLPELDALYSGCGKQPQDIDFVIPSIDSRAEPNDIC